MDAKNPSSSFPPVDASYDFPKLEADVLKFWEKNRIFEKSLEKPAPRGTYVFYEGPPTANNKPHIGHVLTRVVKDLFPRYRTMRGHHVARKAGWDTHGLPVEIAIEKKLGFAGKEAIEAHGVADFNRLCFESVRTYEREWAKVSKRIGFWLDYDDAYFTFTNQYIESVWWLLGRMWEKGQLYQGYKVLPYCPHCGTTLSSHEVAQGYKDIKDPSVTIKVRIKKGQLIRGQDGQTVTADGNLFLLAWTTTPWTLPSNVALAVNPAHEYKIVASRANPGERYLLAHAPDLPVEEPITGADGKPGTWNLQTGEALLVARGADLHGLDYERLFPFAGEQPQRGWYVVAADYVTLSDGTGIVHIAPAYGQDDYLVSQKYDLPFVQLVNGQGRFVQEATPYAGKWFKDADPDVIMDLKRSGLLLKSQKFEHAYPHCWRHDTPLFYNANASWFIRTTEVKALLQRNNQEIQWYPGHLKDGRFGKWLENLVDWAISRKRYWGTPLPIWCCDHCDAQRAISSYASLFEHAGKAMPEDIYDQAQFNPHRPHLDAFSWACNDCGEGTMRRVEEVIDCWFDAGAMPFAQHHYPFENKALIDGDEAFPAEFISEAIDQTRGWFYTLHAIATLITGRPAYKNCIVVGHVLDEAGIKMSKRLGNMVDPNDVLDTVGADNIRWYFFAKVPAGLSSRFSEKLVRESAKAVMIPVWNALSFFSIYANIDGWTPGADPVPFSARDPLDRWILTKLGRLSSSLIDALDHYRIQEATRALESFVDHLNNWYIRRSRRRFWSGAADLAKESAYQTLHQVLTTLARLMAPFIPFMSEYLYQSLERPFAGDGAPESVHLTDYPEPNPAWMDGAVEAAMDGVLRITRLGHAARNLSQVRVRQPLPGATLVTLDDGLHLRVTPYEGIILEELNIKALHWAHDRDAFVSYQVKPNFRKLGPRVGRAMPKVKAAIAALDPAELAAQLETQGFAIILVDGVEERVTSEEVEVSIQQKEGTTTANDDDLLLVLDTQISTALRQEGMAREVINRLQSMRKEQDLAYADRIRVTWKADGALREAIDAFAETIREETLASSFLFASEGGGKGCLLTTDLQAKLALLADDTPSSPLGYLTTDVQGEPLTLWLEVVSDSEASSSTGSEHKDSDGTASDSMASESETSESTASDGTASDSMASDSTASDGTASDSMASDSTTLDSMASDSTTLDSMAYDSTALDSMASDSTASESNATDSEASERKDP